MIQVKNIFKKGFQMISDQDVASYISSLKGRKAYEQKKSKKLGFHSFEDYVENKLLQRLQTHVNIDEEFANSDQNKMTKKEKLASESSCGCCNH